MSGGRALLALFIAALLACATPPRTPSAPPPDDPPPGASANLRPAPPSDSSETGFLAPNSRDVDDTPIYIHYSREQMPIRVNVELPKLAARYASREDTDAAVIGAIKSWEAAIQPALPWFELEIVRDDPDADIQVEWKTRISGDAAGRGGIGWQVVGGTLRAYGRFQYATKPCLAISCHLDLKQLELIVAHEFGHTLGLMHCLDCKSAMNYSWETIDRIFVTETDVKTIRALYEIPNGTRVDGALMIPLREAHSR